MFYLKESNKAFVTQIKNHFNCCADIVIETIIYYTFGLFGRYLTFAYSFFLILVC